MTNYSISTTQQKLERIYNQGEAKTTQNVEFNSGFQQFLQDFFAFLSGSEEPRVSIRRDRTGNKVYKAYDPVTNSSFSSTSETELRTWLEGRYYH
ncbi:hypothetical protein [Spirulina sp. 06S082]|uniref:hypothetical protein n=1 Tax=Spirulina sp. 06S082 TaxID=3110248 RepID=UPI002B1F8C13|nr:hypothetical protein [Spirulina sp. 06S082]MEA5467742.1 hypothetical protein [Spirulina sp. 06S082]